MFAAEVRKACLSGSFDSRRGVTKMCFEGLREVCIATKTYLEVNIYWFLAGIFEHGMG